ncbi:MAG: DUF4823 domain-containing protein [Elusimicrobiaceae bacterium]
MRKIIYLLFVILFAGCATADIDHLSQVQYQGALLQSEQKIFVALPKDGAFGHIDYINSGRDVQQSFYDNFLRYTDQVILAKVELSIDEAKSQALKQNADILVYPVISHWEDRNNGINQNVGILVYPVISHWEDRNTPWSGLRDKVRINITVYSVKDGRTLDKTTMYATNNWLAFVNANPQNRLKTIIDPYVKALYK